MPKREMLCTILKEDVVAVGRMSPFSLNGKIQTGPINFDIVIHNYSENNIQLLRLESSFFKFFDLIDHSKLWLEDNSIFFPHDYQFMVPKNGSLSIKITIEPKRTHGLELIGTFENIDFTLHFERIGVSNNKFGITKLLGLPNKLILYYSPKIRTTEKPINILDYLQFDMSINSYLDIGRVYKVQLIISEKEPGLINKIRDINLVSNPFTEIGQFSEHFVERKMDTILIRSHEFTPRVRGAFKVNPIIEISLDDIKFLIAPAFGPRTVNIFKEEVYNIPVLKIHVWSGEDEGKYMIKATYDREEKAYRAELSDLEFWIFDSFMSRIYIESKSRKIGYAVSHNDLLGIGNFLREKILGSELSEWVQKVMSTSQTNFIEVWSPSYLIPFEMFADSNGLWAIKYGIGNMAGSGPFSDFVERQLPLKILAIISYITVGKKDPRYFKFAEDEINYILSLEKAFKNIVDVRILKINKNGLFEYDKEKQREIPLWMPDKKISTIKEIIVQKTHEYNFDILHLSGESSTIDEKSGELYLLIDPNIKDKNLQLSADEISELIIGKRKVPIVFSNFCNSVIYSYIYSPQIEFHTKIASKTYAYIGPFAYIPSYISASITKEFYHNLFEPLKQGELIMGQLSTEFVSEALKKAKLNLFLSRKSRIFGEDVSYLFFVLFGNPLFRIITV